jgi:hypothetical protein
VPGCRERAPGALDKDFSAVDSTYVQQALDKRCLSGPIHSDQAEECAFVYLEADLIQQGKASIGLGN